MYPQSHLCLSVEMGIKENFSRTWIVFAPKITYLKQIR